MTSTGYGDIAPTTWFGKMVASGTISGYISHHIFRFFYRVKDASVKGQCHLISQLSLTCLVIFTFLSNSRNLAVILSFFRFLSNVVFDINTSGKAKTD
jgi:hypothetical protein